MSLTITASRSDGLAVYGNIARRPSQVGGAEVGSGLDNARRCRHG